MTNDPREQPTSFSVEQALSRFDDLIDTLTAPQVAEVVSEAGIDAVDESSSVAPASESDSDSVTASDSVADVVPAPVSVPPQAADDVATEESVIEAPFDAATSAPADADSPVVLSVEGLLKRFGDTVAVDGIDLDVRAGQIFGIVGPNGAGKTTTLSIVTGVLRPDQGTVRVGGKDVWADPAAAKREVGILPDRLLLFDRLTGRQLLYYSGMLRGLDRETVLARSAELIEAFDLADAQDRLVTDYSAGMTRKVALAAAMIHSPRLLILDEPFESVDAVSVATVLEILRDYTRRGGTVVLSSHSMELVEHACDAVAVIAEGRILTTGTTESVRGDASLEERFVRLIGDLKPGEDMEWLRSFSD